MVFRNRRFAPIKTDKHEITWSDLAIDAGVTVEKTLIQGIASASKNVAIECEVGSHVRSIYFEINFSAQTVTNPKVVHWQVSLLPSPGNQTASIANSYYQNDRSQIIKRGMEMLPADTSTVFKRIFVVRIPKKAQRIADSAFVQFKYQCSLTETINVCGFAIYKEQY